MYTAAGVYMNTFGGEDTDSCAIENLRRTCDPQKPY